MRSGGGAIESQKENKAKQEAGLKSHFLEKSRSELLSGTKVPLPEFGADALASAILSGTKVPPPKKHSHLPHIDLAEYYQFVTFRTYDSVDEFIRKWDFSPAMSNKEKQLKIDEYLDTSANGAYLKNEVLEWLFEFLLSQDKKLYELVAFAIMNNHVHILFKPLDNLRKVMQIIKGVSAKKINEILGKSGKFWADDYYDKAIRDENHFWVVYEYIKNNPLKIGGIKGGTKVPPPIVFGTDTSVSENISGTTIGGTKVPLPNNTSGTKVPLPNDNTPLGSGVSTPQKENKAKQKAGLKSHFLEKSRSELLSGTKVPPPIIFGTDTSVSENISGTTIGGTKVPLPNNTSGTKVPLPNDNTPLGSGVSTPQKENKAKQKAGLKSHFLEKSGSELLSGAKVPLPEFGADALASAILSGTTIGGTKVPLPNNTSRTRVPISRFYGVYK